MSSGSSLESIFFACLGMRTPEERAAYLTQACAGDRSLFRRVAKMLEAQGKGFLEEAAFVPDLTAEPPAGEGSGARIGPYRLVEKLGEGGMGTVWRAEQLEPVQRQVALKLIKAGMDSREVIARFEAERQALALMDHPNIARVLDGGTDGAGRPYFVMDLFAGVPITRYCDERQLGVRQRLALFIQVCEAIQHAHQKGVIHRDIKPSNVLVALQDGRAVPKVIDFGIAKAIESKLTGHTVLTQQGGFIGTLEYMSPEQAARSALGVDTRTDIYSLGALLYELLTGTTPLSRQRLAQASYGDILRVITDEETPKPSTRLQESGDRLAAVSAQRSVEPARLTSTVRGDLDWIVMKALEKDRNRRYEAASALAQDLQRLLDDEPVLACPPSAAYRLRKLARKHRTALQVAGGFLLLLVAGVVASVWQAVQATRAKEVARTAEGQALDALRALTDEVIERQMARQVRLSEEDRAFLQRILAHYQRFAATKGDHVEGRLVQVEGISRVALIRMRLGERQEAMAGLRRASELFRSLAAELPADPTWRRMEARTHNNLAILLSDLGQAQEAEAEQRLALELESRLAAASPQDPQCRHDVARSQLNLGNLLFEQGKWTDAEAQLRLVLGVGPELMANAANMLELRSTLASAHNGLGNLMRAQGRRQDAEAELRQAIAIWAQLHKESPRDVEFRRELARSHNNLSTVLQELEKRRDAATAMREALQIQARLCADYPTVPEDRHQLATSHNNLSPILLRLGEPGQAEAESRRALVICEQLVAEFADVPEYRECLATSHSSLGNALHHLGRSGDAETAHRAGLAMRQRLAADFPMVPRYAVDLGSSLCNLGNLLVEKPDELEDALDCYRKAIQTLQQLLAREPRNATARLFLCNSYQGSALTLERLGRDDEAFTQLEKVIEYAEGATLEHYLLVRINWLALTQPAAAMTALEEFFRRPEPYATDPLTLARLCCLVVNSIEDEARREAFGARAVALIGQALAKGDFADPSRRAALKQDPTLAAVRQRADFRKLFVEGAGKPAGGGQDR